MKYVSLLTGQVVQDGPHNSVIMTQNGANEALLFIREAIILIDLKGLMIFYES